MKRLRLILLTAVVSAMLTGCGTTSTVPVTGRKHTLLVSDAQVLSLSNQEYIKFMKSAKLSSDATNTAMVKRVGTRLANAVESYLRTHGATAEIKNFAWEFNLIQNKEANAFCMPGGKIVVYEGLLPYTQNEASLAIVLGHEIAHAVAKHSAEQMSKQIRQQSAIASQGFSFANLKYSRNNESEADHMGLIFAAMAGYDPREAIPFWQRMAQGNGNRNDIFSDHPSDASRIAALKREMPEAMKYYQAAVPSAGRNNTVRFSNTTKKKKRRR